MSQRDEVKAFLTTRRARITPEQAGLPVYGRSSRRVPGLRRGEVAQLAGVSVEYYSRLERGDISGVSDSVLDALARALHLDASEQAHLRDLARAAGPARASRRTPARKVPASVERLVHRMGDVPAFVRNGRLDALAVNTLGAALYAPMFDGTPAGQVPNFARFNFLDPQAHEFWPNWVRAADETVGMLRTAAGQDPYDRDLSDLIGELSTRSEDFRVRWAQHQVDLHQTGLKHFRHPVVGELRLAFDGMQLPTEPHLILTTFTAEDGSPDDDALRMLASWAATREAADSQP